MKYANNNDSSLRQGVLKTLRVSLWGDTWVCRSQLGVRADLDLFLLNQPSGVALAFLVDELLPRAPFSLLSLLDGVLLLNDPLEVVAVEGATSLCAPAISTARFES